MTHDDRPELVRIVTLNLWQEQGPWQRRLELVGRRLQELGPAVVCLQEVREVAGRVPNQARTLADQLGMSCVYEVAQPWGGGDEGVAVLSRHPIRETAVRELPYEPGSTRRVALAALVELPRGVQRWFVTTHLAYRMGDGIVREQQVCEIDRFVQELRGGQSAIVAGDFNAAPEADEIRFLVGLTTLEGRRAYYQDAYGLRHPGERGWTWCTDNPYTGTLSTLPADRRLDYIFVTQRRANGEGRIASCEIVMREAEADGLRCSDHYAVMADVAL